MNCNEARLLMSAALDGELSVTEKQQFHEHLPKCNDCCEEFDEAKKTKMIIKGCIIRLKAPQKLVDSILHLTNCNSMKIEESPLM